MWFLSWEVSARLHEWVSSFIFIELKTQSLIFCTWNTPLTVKFPIKSVRCLPARLWINNPLSWEKIPLKGNMIFNLHFNDGTASIRSSQSSTDAKVTRNGPCIGHKTTMDKSLPARPFLSAFSSLCRNYLCAENTKLLPQLSPKDDKSINKHFFEVVEVVHDAANSSILIKPSFVPYYSSFDMFCVFFPNVFCT